MIETVLQALVEPHRREILEYLRAGELSSGQVSAHFTLTRPAVSQHLKVLTEAGLITMRREGTKRIYRARPQGLAELRKFIETFWDDSLQELKRQAEAEEKKARQRDKRK